MGKEIDGFSTDGLRVSTRGETRNGNRFSSTVVWVTDESRLHVSGPGYGSRPEETSRYR